MREVERHRSFLAKWSSAPRSADGKHSRCARAQPRQVKSSHLTILAEPTVHSRLYHVRFYLYGTLELKLQAPTRGGGYHTAFCHFPSPPLGSLKSTPW